MQIYKALKKQPIVVYTVAAAAAAAELIINNATYLGGIQAEHGGERVQRRWRHDGAYQRLEPSSLEGKQLNVDIASVVHASCDESP